MMLSMGAILILFLSTLSLRRATDTSSLMKCQVKFLSTLSLRRATEIPYQRKIDQKNFYPRSPCGERPKRLCNTLKYLHFYPRSPCGERRVHYDNYNLHCVISIHALLAESDGVHYDNYNLHCVISIHALLAESDKRNKKPLTIRLYFYPRSPCGERQDTPSTSIPNPDFYPRSPCGERRAPRITPTASRNFYPRSPCGERPMYGVMPVSALLISIHALLAESDVVDTLKLANTMLFLSTLSLRRATCYSLRHSTQGRHFYPRSPCGERRVMPVSLQVIPLISIHALLAESDAPPAPQGESTITISIHALLAESDSSMDDFEPSTTHFYPRSPCGERPQCKL